MTPLVQRASSLALGSVTSVFADHPWRSKSVRLAFLVVVIGMAFWIKNAFEGSPTKPHGTAITDSSNTSGSAAGIHLDRPVPGYVKACASYIGGFLIGWTFRRFVKITFLAALLIFGIF